jgi:pimeloyl-ACP methyl ester carboxylesterase
MADTRIKVGPHTLAVTIAGPKSAPTFVLVHGIGVSRRYFRPLQAELARHSQVVSLDLPGFGSSSRPQDALNIPELADTVAALITQENWKDPILIGQSMGCQVVSQVLAQHPEISAKAILVSPTVYDRERTAWMQTCRLLQDGLHEPLKVNLLALSDYIRCGIFRYVGTLPSMLSDQIENRLPACQAEVVIIKGGQDRIVPYDWAQKLSNLLPHGSLTVIPGAPHLLQYTHPAQVAQICLNLAQS